MVFEFRNLQRSGSETSESTLTAIVDEDNVELLELFLTEFNVENEAVLNQSLMQHAIEKSALKCVQVFLDLGVKAREKSLVKKAIDKEDLRLLQFIGSSESELLEEVVEENGRTVLHIAAELGKPEVVKFLLKINANWKDQQDYNGCTPLHACSSSNHMGAMDCMNILIEHGADIEMKDNMGLTPVHKAAFGKNLFRKFNLT